MDNNIELQNVSKKYKDFELKNISFNVPQGCIVGLIGETWSSWRKWSRKNHYNKINTKYY